MYMLEIILYTMTCIGVIGVSLISRVLAEDAKTFIPRFAERLIRRAAARLHEAHAEELCEEWLAHLGDKPEISGKLWHALSIYGWGADRIGRTVGYANERSRLFRSGERIAGIVLSVYIFPVLVLIYCIVYALYCGKEVIITRESVGRDGKKYLKREFRTLEHAEDRALARNFRDGVIYTDDRNETEMLMKKPDFTVAGRFLWKSRLDEIPAVLNVLSGDVSIIDLLPIPAHWPGRSN